MVMGKKLLISRQLWWGHRIPAYHCRFAGEEAARIEDIDDDAHWFTGRNEADAKAKAESTSGKKVIEIFQGQQAHARICEIIVCASRSQSAVSPPAHTFIRC
jgi:valyl-tRNA synthetase